MAHENPIKVKIGLGIYDKMDRKLIIQPRTNQRVSPFIYANGIQITQSRRDKFAKREKKSLPQSKNNRIAIMSEQEKKNSYWDISTMMYHLIESY